MATSFLALPLVAAIALVLVAASMLNAPSSVGDQRCLWKPERDYGSCEKILGYFFNGASCVAVSGCDASGDAIPFSDAGECNSACSRPEDGPAPVPFTNVPFTLDSGTLANAESVEEMVTVGTVSFPAAPWIRIHFSDQTSLPPGSRILLTSLKDGDWQTFAADSLAAYGYGSAYFNGGEVRIDLVMGPGTAGNRVAVASVDVGAVPG